MPAAMVHAVASARANTAATAALMLVDASPVTTASAAQGVLPGELVDVRHGLDHAEVLADLPAHGNGLGVVGREGARHVRRLVEPPVEERAVDVGLLGEVAEHLVAVAERILDRGLHHPVELLERIR